MPRLTVWFVRAALIYLLLGFTFGALLLLHKGLPLHPALWSLLPAHIEFVLFGWTVQLVLGMAFWILPRFAHPPVRGNEKPAWAAFVLINLGVLLLALSAFGPGGAWAVLLGRSAEAAGVIAFAVHAWPRVKGVKD
jgi:heme/copper-type cytochrome/quinol oxidase subunit 1